MFASVAVYLLRNDIGHIFTDNSEVAMLVTNLILPFMLYQFGDGLQCNYSNALRGIADVKPVMKYAFISYIIILLPLAYLFAFVFNWGLTGIWLSFPFGLTIAGILFFIRFMSKTKNKNTYIQ